MKKLSDTNMALFFTGGVSLKTWADVGNLDREIEIYKRLTNHINRVNFVTYGGKQDILYSSRIEPIRLLPTKWHRMKKFTLMRLLAKYSKELRGTDILKTNQILGSEVPIFLKKMLGKKLIVRCGYSRSWNEIIMGMDQSVVRESMKLEKIGFSAADVVVVTSSWQREWIISRYNIAPAKVEVIPNYVVTDIFKPNPEVGVKFDILFVGRGGKGKNLSSLLEAIRHLQTEQKKISLLMVGGCSRDENLKEVVSKYDLNVTFIENISNFRLPKLINQAKVFILPSFYEGHPKVLLEAMGCGLPCIGTNVTGIKENIKHMETGYLCETDYLSIAQAVEKVLSDKALREEMGKKARKYIVKNYAVEKVLERELDVIKEVIG